MSARRAGKDPRVLRTQTTAVLILVIIVALVWMERTGTAANVLQASQGLTAGSISTNASLLPVPLELRVSMKLMGTAAFAHQVVVVQDVKKLQEGLALPAFE